MSRPRRRPGRGAAGRVALKPTRLRRTRRGSLSGPYAIAPADLPDPALHARLREARAALLDALDLAELDEG